MRRNIAILLLFIFIAACVPSTQETLVQTFSKETDNLPTLNPLDMQEETPFDSLTPANLTTITPFPSATVVSYPIPSGLLTHQELKHRIEDWIYGEIELTDSERLLDEKTGKERKLGILEKPWLDDVILLFYNLGFTLIEDQEGIPYLINVVGFEDGNGDRFTTVFHNGKLQDQNAIILLSQWRGRRINQEEHISSEQLLPEEFADISSELPMSVYIGATNTDGVTGREAWNEYLVIAKDAMTALTDFLICEDCSMEDVPEILKPITNTVPEEYYPDIPYLYDYDVSYW